VRKLIWLLILPLLLISCPPPRITAWDLCPRLILTLDFVEKKALKLRFPGEVSAVGSIFKPNPAYWEEEELKEIYAVVREFVNKNYAKHASEKIHPLALPYLYHYELQGKKIRGIWLPWVRYRTEWVWVDRFMLVAEVVGEESASLEVCRKILSTLLGTTKVFQMIYGREASLSKHKYTQPQSKEE